MTDTNHSDNGGTNPLTELVGPDKKYKSIEELAKSRKEADAFIEQLKEENRIAREELAALAKDSTSEATVSELIKLVKKGRDSGETKDDKPSDDELTQKVLDIIKGDAKERQRALNREEGESLVLAKFNGDVEAANAHKTMKAKEYGMSVERLTALSEESPALFAKIVEVELRNGNQSPTTLGSARNTQQHAGPVEEIDGAKTKAYYDRVRKEMGPRKYLSDLSLQKQILRDRTKLGDRFYQN